MKRLGLAIPKLILCAGLILWGSVTAQTSWTPPSGERLRDLADKAGLLIGYVSAKEFWALPDIETYRQVAKSEFNLANPEYLMNWQPIHPQPQTYRFDRADRHIQFALDNGMKMRGHPLVWNQALPDWLTSRTWAHDELLAILYDHIDKVAGRYAEKIAQWDVVNEAIENDGAYRKNIWYTTIGPEYTPSPSFEPGKQPPMRNCSTVTITTVPRRSTGSQMRSMTC